MNELVSSYEMDRTDRYVVYFFCMFLTETGSVYLQFSTIFRQIDND